MKNSRTLKISVISGLFFSFASATFAEPYQLNSKVLQHLEERVWTTSEQGLPQLEKEVIKQIQLNPYEPFPFYLLTHLRLREFTNRPEDLALIKQAADLAQQAVDLSPATDFGYVALAETLDLMGQSQKGIELLESARNAGVEPTWRIYFTLARLHAESGSKEKILALLEQSLGFMGTQPNIIVPYVVAVLQTSSHGMDLLTTLHEWNRKFPNILFQQTVAIVMAEAGKYKDAHKVYQSIYTRHPDYNEALVNDGILLYQNLNQPKEAALLFKRVLATKNAAALEPEMLTMIHSHLGASYLRANSIPDAEEEFIHATKRATDKVAILDFVTKAYREAKQGKHLSHLFERLTLEIQPTGLLYALLGESQSEDQRNHEAALKSFANAILLEPGRSDFYNGMGLAYYRMQRQEDALRLFKEATKVDPNDATARYNEACVLSRLGRIEQAIGSLQEAITLDPRLVDTARKDADFVNMNTNADFRKLILSPAEQITPEKVFGH